MADLEFDPTIGLLKNAITGARVTQDAIANNIANVNTPNYRRETVSFKESLAASLGAPPDPDELGLTVDQPGMIPVNDGIQPTPFVKPTPQVDDAIQMRVDKSNVDLDQEMAELAENTGYRQTMSALLKTQYSQLGTLFRENP